MNAFGEFLAMGGYAAYVWSAYGAAALVLGALWLAALRRWKQANRDRAKLGAEEQRGS